MPERNNPNNKVARRTSKSMKKSIHNKISGGGSRCDKLRTRLAVIKTQLSQRYRYRTLTKFGKELQKAYLSLITIFCNERFRPTANNISKMTKAMNSLERSYERGILTHTEFVTAALKASQTLAGVTGRSARRGLREMRDPDVTFTDQDRVRLLRKLENAMTDMNHDPVL